VGFGGMDGMKLAQGRDDMCDFGSGTSDSIKYRELFD